VVESGGGLTVSVPIEVVHPEETARAVAMQAKLNSPYREWNLIFIAITLS